MRALLTASLVLGLATAAMAQTVDLKVGDQAPNFKLQATDGKTYQLSDFKGKQAVVLAWFPAAFTRGCTIECKSLAENGDKIKKYDVSYFMASVDPIEKNTEFAKAKSVTLGQGANQQIVEKKEADFPLLSDPTKETAKAYGVLERPRRRQPLDVLHRQGREDLVHREDGEARDVSRGHDQQDCRAEGPDDAQGHEVTLHCPLLS